MSYTLCLIRLAESMIRQMKATVQQAQRQQNTSPGHDGQGEEERAREHVQRDGAGSGRSPSADFIWGIYYNISYCNI